MLRYSQKLTALGRLSAGVAHEVKNPLNAMMIHLELLRQKLSGAHAAARGGRRRQRATAARHGRGLGRDAPDVAAATRARQRDRRRDQAARSGAAGFPQVHAARRPAPAARQGGGARRRGRAGRAARSRESGVRIETDCAAGVPTSTAIPAMLRQALLNLAINACQATPRNGMLRFRVRAGAPAPRRDSCRRHRRRHQAGAPAAYLRSVLHDAGKGQRHRALDGVPDCAAARW